MCLAFASHLLCFGQLLRNTNQLWFVDISSCVKFASMPFYIAWTLFNKLSHDYWNFCRTWIVCTGIRRNCFLVHELGRDMQLPRAPRRRKILPTTSLSTWNFFRWPTTVRNVETIYRWALELVIILLLLRFHSATRCSNDNEENERVPFLIPY